jgi:hypothetical protein
MKKILILLSIFLLPSMSFASQTIGIDVPCVDGDIGNIKFVFMASGVKSDGEIITANTNLETREGNLWIYNHEFLLKAKCDNPLSGGSSHLSFFTQYNGLITYSASWVAVDNPTMELTLKLYSFAFGVILALAFIGGIKSHEK